MARFLPFRGLRYDLSKLSDFSAVIAPPYDVISRSQCEALHVRHPQNVIRLILGDPFTLTKAEQEDVSRYRKAAETLAAWKKDGTLEQEKEPSSYVVEDSFEWKGTRLQRRGIIGLVELETLGRGNILPHERTLAGPIEDRLKLLTETQTHLSPIYLIAEDPSHSMSALLDRTTSFPPLVQFANRDEKIEHRFWRISSPLMTAEIQRILKDVPFLIADGHHRYATALHFAEKEGHRLPESRFMLTYLATAPDPGLVLGAIHRVLSTTFSKEELDKKLLPHFHLNELPLEEKHFTMANAPIAWIDGRQSTMTLLTPKQPSSMLPTEILNHEIMKPIFGLDLQHPEDQRKIQFVKSANEVVELTKSPHRIGFWLKPLRVEQVIEMAKRGEVLPQKSTFFYPKVMTGFVFHSLS